MKCSVFEEVSHEGRRIVEEVSDDTEKRKKKTEKVPEEELNTRDKPVCYLPHHPVTHPLTPSNVRVVHDCATKF